MARVAVALARRVARGRAARAPPRGRQGRAPHTRLALRVCVGSDLVTVYLLRHEGAAYSGSASGAGCGETQHGRDDGGDRQDTWELGPVLALTSWVDVTTAGSTGIVHHRWRARRRL